MSGDNPKVSLRRENFELVFDQVDARAGTGRIIGNLGGEDVHVQSAREGMTFFEMLGSGFFQVTVIYVAQNGDGQFKAVHSRHTASLGAEPVPSQYYGSCRALL